jgi:hypothetical protein
MRRAFYLRLVLTGIASPVVMLSAYELSRNVSDWFGAPFFAPGMLAAAIVLPTGVHSDHPDLYIQLSMILSFFFTWILLLLILKVSGSLIYRMKTNIRENY